MPSSFFAPGQHGGYLGHEQLPKLCRRLDDESGPGRNGPGSVVGGGRSGGWREKQPDGVSPKRKIDQNAFDENKRRFDENLELLLKASVLPGETNLQQVATNYYRPFSRRSETISTLDAPENQRLIYERDVVANGQRINAGAGKHP